MKLFTIICYVHVHAFLALPRVKSYSMCLYCNHGEYHGVDCKSRFSQNETVYKNNKNLNPSSLRPTFSNTRTFPHVTLQ